MKFTSTLQALHLPFTQTGIPIPEHVLADMPPGRWRLQGTINGFSFNLAPRSLADGTKFLTVGGNLKKQLHIQIGEPVRVDFQFVDADLLEIPDVLQSILEFDEAARDMWQQYSVGLQRSLVHYINAVKSTDSKIKRALELTANMKSGRYPIAQKRK